MKTSNTVYEVSYEKHGNWQQQKFTSYDEANEFANKLEQDGYYVEVEVYCFEVEQ